MRVRVLASLVPGSHPSTVRFSTHTNKTIEGPKVKQLSTKSTRFFPFATRFGNRRVDHGSARAMPVSASRAKLASMKAELAWKGGLTFGTEVPSGAALTFDSADEGEAPKGSSPMETFLAALAACAAMDVISILKKKRQE